MLASDQFAGAGESEPLDRVRMQKGVFLLEMRGPDSWRELYKYVPYDWGPYSRQLAGDVSRLLASDRLDLERVPQHRYSAYRTSELGEEEIEDVVEQLPDAHKDFVRRVRHFVTSRSFNKLLRDVYAEYPDYAVASRFNP